MKLRPYIAFGRVAFLEMLAYRTRYVIGILTYFVSVSVYYFIWKGIYGEGGGAIGGLTLEEMLTYVAVGWIGRSFYSNSVDREIESAARSGDITVALIRPVSFWGMHAATALGQSVYRIVLFSAPISVPLFLAYPIRPPASVAAGAAFLVSMFLALWIVVDVNFLIGTLAVHIKSVPGIIRAKDVGIQLLSGLLLPLSLMPDGLRAVCEALPFAGIAWVPGMIYLGKVQGLALAQALAFQAAWAAALTAACAWAWSRAGARLSVQGG